MNVGYSLNQILINDKKNIFFWSEVGEGRGDGGEKKHPPRSGGGMGNGKLAPLPSLDGEVVY